jgi:O-antigen/teichoic acid export membrane protein
MSVVRRQGIKNIVYTYAGILLGIVSTLFVQPFFLEKEQIGILRLVISVGTILASMSCLGVTAVIVKYFPLFHNPEKKHGHIFTLALLVPLIGSVSLIGLLILSPLKNLVVRLYGANGYIFDAYFWPIGLTTFFICLIFSFSAYCNSINKSSLSTFVNEVVNRVLFILCILLFAWGLFTQDQFVYAISYIYLLQVLCLLLLIRRFDNPSVSLAFFKKNPYLKTILTFGLTSAFIQITGISIKFIDVIMVGKYLSIKDVGVYSIAAFIGLVVETPLGALEKIAGPRIARAFAQNNTEEIKRMYSLSSKYLMVFCGMLCCVLIAMIEPVLSLLPGDYSSGTLVTIIICLGAFFNASTGVNYSIITYSRFYRFSALFYSVLLLITIALNIALIPVLGMMGAAIATGVISVLHNLLRMMIIWVKFHIQPFTWQNLWIVLSMIASIGISWPIALENPYMQAGVRGGVAFVIFAGGVLITKVFSLADLKNELTGFKKVFF